MAVEVAQTSSYQDERADCKGVGLDDTSDRCSMSIVDYSPLQANCVARDPIFQSVLQSSWQDPLVS
jgi:hypothetical protein